MIDEEFSFNFIERWKDKQTNVKNKFLNAILHSYQHNNKLYRENIVEKT